MTNKLPNAYCVVIPFTTKREAAIALEQISSNTYYIGKVIHQYYPEDSKRIRIQKQLYLIEESQKRLLEYKQRPKQQYQKQQELKQQEPKKEITYKSDLPYKYKKGKLVATG